jgi:hypothetical protein
VDDEAWVERLRRAVADGLDNRDEPDRSALPPPGQNGRTEVAPSSPMSAEVVSALRDLERRLTAVDTRLRQLNESRDRLVEDIADAVLARLDARGGRFSG